MKSVPSSPPMRKADPRYRRRALWMLMLLAAVGAAGLHFGLPAMHTWIVRATPQSLRLLWLVLTLALFLPVLGVAARLYGFARLSQREGLWPPSRMRLLRDTPVLEGVSALRRARLALAVAVTLALFGLAGFVMMILAVRLMI